MSKPVLLLVRTLGEGGCERDLTKLALTLDRNRFTPHVGAIIPGGMRADEIAAAGVPLVNFPVGSLVRPAALAAVWRLRRYIRQHGIELIHAFDLSTDILAAYARLCGRPPLVASHLWQRRPLARQSRLLLRATDHIPDAIVVNAESTRQELIEQEGLSAARIFTIHNGVDLAVFYPKPDEPRPACVRDATLVIGTACALRPEKRVDLLIEAFARVRRPGIQLLITGSGVMLDSLERQRDALGLGDSCWFEPQKSDIAPWLRALDIYVLSSETESFPNALLEAMACGCAVVGSAVGGVPELIDDGRTGRLFAAGDVAALAQCLRELIDHPELRQRLAHASAQRAGDEFRMELNKNRTQALYDRLLN